MSTCALAGPGSATRCPEYCSEYSSDTTARTSRWTKYRSSSTVATDSVAVALPAVNVTSGYEYGSKPYPVGRPSKLVSTVSGSDRSPLRVSTNSAVSPSSTTLAAGAMVTTGNSSSRTVTRALLRAGSGTTPSPSEVDSTSTATAPCTSLTSSSSRSRHSSTSVSSLSSVTVRCPSSPAAR